MKRVAVTACVALGTAGILAAAMSAAQAGGAKSSVFTERDLVVTLVTPTVNQEVLSDLSDPGLNNVITVRFSSILNARDVIDTQNVVNQLSAKVEFLDATFARLPGTPSVRRNLLTFDPFTLNNPVLATGQYTLNLKSSIRNTRGRMLNRGVADYSTTFTVGTDVFPPVLRKISPLEGQTNIGLLQPIVATFNEPIDRASAIANVSVVNASSNPPTVIPGAGGGSGVTMARGNFDVVFTPDPCFGYPPKTNIQFLIQGNNPAGPTPVPNTLTDVFGNRFAKDPGLQWQADPTIPTTFHSPNGFYDTITGIYSMQFQTKGTRPAPLAPRAGGPQMNYPPPYYPNCQAQLWLAPACEDSGKGVHYTTNSGLGELDLRAYINRFNQGITDFSLIALLANAPVRLGRPAGVTFDPRLIPGVNTPFGYVLLPDSMQTFIYVVDEQSATVEVVRSDSFKVIGRFVGFQDPRDVGVATNTSQSATTLYVSNFGSNEVIGVNLQGIAVTFGGQPGAQSPCDAIKDNQGTRARIPVGQGPTEVATDSYLQQTVMVTNSLGGSVTLIDPKTNKALKTADVGSNPVGCDWNTIQFGRIKIGLIANQGGLNDPNGSLSLYIKSPPLNGGFLGAGQNRDGVESTLTDGIKNPTHVWGNQKWIDPPPPAGTLTSVPVVWYASNTGGNTVMDLRLNVTGIFGLSITPQVQSTFTVGQNPSSACLDAYFPSADLYTSVLGTGSVGALYPVRNEPSVNILTPGVRRLFTPYTN
jgi:YVTN family beta-propeller protein